MTDTPVFNMTADQLAALGKGHFVYIREMSREKTAEMLGDKIDLPQVKSFYALFDADGSPVSLSPTREAAIASAFEHELTPVAVH